MSDTYGQYWRPATSYSNWWGIDPLTYTTYTWPDVSKLQQSIDALVVRVGCIETALGADAKDLDELDDRLSALERWRDDPLDDEEGGARIADALHRSLNADDEPCRACASDVLNDAASALVSAINAGRFEGDDPLSSAINRAKLADYAALRDELADAQDTIAEQARTISYLRETLRNLKRWADSALDANDAQGSEEAGP